MFGNILGQGTQRIRTLADSVSSLNERIDRFAPLFLSEVGSARLSPEARQVAMEIKASIDAFTRTLQVTNQRLQSSEEALKKNPVMNLMGMRNTVEEELQRLVSCSDALIASLDKATTLFGR